MKVNSLLSDSHVVYGLKAAATDSHEATPQSVTGVEKGRLEAVTEFATASQKLVVNGFGLGLRFAIDEPTGRCIISVIDIESGEVIRQIPPEDAIEFLHRFGAQKGLFFSRRL
jgi:flagellar protein FlaG